ncbi:MAG: GGDEF domain-containing protein [Treponema sp.]|nr:GGDEF domain-containing protein [Treponema sp.]
MKKFDAVDHDKDFLSNPKIVEHYSLLQEIGIFNYVSTLGKEIQNYKNLLAGALDIFNRTTISEIMDATVWQISDHFLPSFIVFLWKPLQNREDVTIKSYRNYKPVDLNINVDSITSLEPFFLKYPHPINYDLFSYEIGENETIKSFDSIKPELVIPIMGPSGLYGMVLVGPRILEDDYSHTELVYMQDLMSFVSKAIQNNLHYERTLRDVKTGLFNNGFFMSRLNEEIARAKRNQTKSSIIMMDVDKFKRFNDTYGHIAGDRVLESVAITLKQGVRAEDVPSRFGGEEFSVLLPDTDMDPAWVVAERLRTMVATMKVPWEPPLPQVTISLGVCTFDKNVDATAEDIIHQADEALYLSKERGRNRTTVWGAGLLNKIRWMTAENIAENT